MSFSHNYLKKIQESGENETKPTNRQWEHLDGRLLSPLLSFDCLYLLAILLISVEQAVLQHIFSRLRL